MTNLLLLMMLHSSLSSNANATQSWFYFDVSLLCTLSSARRLHFHLNSWLSFQWQLYCSFHVAIFHRVTAAAAARSDPVNSQCSQACFSHGRCITAVRYTVWSKKLAYLWYLSFLLN